MGNKRHSLTEQLYAACRIVVESHSGDIAIAPSLVAQLAMKNLDKLNSAPAVVSWGCTLQCRHAAREILRKQFDPTADDFQEGDAHGHPIFPNLQLRYPTKRGVRGDPEYVLLEQLTDGERALNVSQMRSRGQRLLDHAAALEAWQPVGIAKNG